MHKKIIIAIFILFIVSLLGWLIFFQAPEELEKKDPQTLNLSQAARLGEIATHKLLVKIDDPRGEGGYERGDVIGVFPDGRDFSDAEKEGFLIIKINITERQGELLMLSLEEKIGKKSEGEMEEAKMLKIRKFGVDLNKIGIGDDEKRGRVIEDRVFEWGVLYAKEK